MKRLLLRKRVDLAGQCIMALPALCIVSPCYMHLAWIAYVTVGIWQSVSCLLWALWPGADSRGSHTSRREYQVLLGIILTLSAVCLLPGILLPPRPGRFIIDLIRQEAGMLLFPGPVMAIWYAALTLAEIKGLSRSLKHRYELQMRQV